MSMKENRDVRMKRLRYQSWHRGCKETDEILGHFCDANLAGLSDAELDVFEAFLNEDDHDIWQWVGHGVVPDNPAYLPFIEILRRGKHHVAC